MRQAVPLSILSVMSIGMALLIPALAASPDAASPDTASPEVTSAAAADDQILSETIRAMVENPPKGIVENPKDLQAVRAFYASRNNVPVWVRRDGPTEKMQAAVSRLKAADQDGLNASDYAVPATEGTTPEKLARSELALMAAVLKYARHAQAGRVDPSRISINIAFTPPAPDPSQVLDAMATSSDVKAVLDSYNPPHSGFQDLRAKLRELRASVDTKPDKAKASTIESIISNMERWRWLPRDLGNGYVLVNIPDYSLTVIRGGSNAFHTRIVVGKKDTPSPVFSDEIESVQVNPTWHVPPAVLARNPGMVGRGDFVVSRRSDGSLGASQRPGPKNALGQIKVNFPNPFLVYLHDTPDKHLFKLDKRAYSSGCMRVENPDQFAAQVLSIGAAEGNYTAAQLKALYNKGERVISLPTRVPVYLVYMNTFVADGRLVTKPDIYDYDARVQSALKGRYLVVHERSQRGSSVRRAERPNAASRQTRVGDWSYFGSRRSGFGFF